jgi:TetR/AcrR family transcriptional regulator, ethionamide resistance regulator
MPVEATTTPKSTRPGRSRRVRRMSGDERERAILQTAERLLEKHSLTEISVDDLARGAGISRSTFYFYFPSRDAVILTLVERMVDEAAERKDEALTALRDDPRAGWRQGIEAFYEIFGGRRGAILAAAELRATNAEARTLWSEVMEGWTADVTAIIEAERERGAAQSGLPARDLAIALLQMNERVQHATFAAERPAVPEGHVVDVLLEVWLSAIYGTPAPG